MNAPHFPAAGPLTPPPLATALFACLAGASPQTDATPESQWLQEQARRLPTPGMNLDHALASWEDHPPTIDAPLHRLASLMRLNTTETITLALALAVETDAAAARVMAWLQAPRREARPSVGMVSALDSQRGVSVHASLTALLDGAALASGLLQLDRPCVLADATLHIPLPIVLALCGGVGSWAGVTLDAVASSSLPPGLRRQAWQQAHALQAKPGGLAVGSGHPSESQAVCVEIAHALGLRPAFIRGDPPLGLAPWLLLHGAMPVYCRELTPGEQCAIPRLPGWEGAWLVAGGKEGAYMDQNTALTRWLVPVPEFPERIALWRACGVDEAAAAQLGAVQRHAGTRIAELAESAESLRLARGDAALTMAHVVTASRAFGAGLLGGLAELLPEDIGDAAIVLPDSLRQELLALESRCRLRDGLADTLGPSALARYRPGVRALLVGPSGTGKTLACGWLATRLGMPLYRVDLSAITSKYIGETEKNLGELFARAEHTEVMLMFDEADALFGKRTEVKDANDRFANQQTNYLLQRIESYAGIVLLTSNSRSRFDAAFTRRLDAIVEFPAPSPDERLALWRSHLGGGHTLTAAELNCLAAACELAGGHIRNITLTAKAMADTQPIGFAELTHALAAEYRKLGKQSPINLLPPGSPS